MKDDVESHTIKNERQRLNGFDILSNDMNREDGTSIGSRIQEVSDIPTITPEVDDDLRSAIKKFMTQPYVENTILALIVINSIMMGIGTFGFIAEHKTSHDIFYYFDLLFLIIFTVEVTLTIFHQRSHALTDLWVVFDFLIIAISWITASIGNFEPHSGEDRNVQIIRSLRIFRILSRIESFKGTMNAIIGTLPGLAALAIFLGIIMFIFGIFFTEQYGDNELFSTFNITLFTLYQISSLDAWSDILREVQVTHPLAWIPFLIYVILTSFIIVNLEIAIIFESILKLNTGNGKEEKKDKKKEEKIERDMKDLERLMYSMRCEVWDHLERQNPEANESKYDGSLTQSLIIDVEESAAGRSIFDNQSEHGKDIFFRDGECCKPTDSMSTLCGRIVNHAYVQGFLVVLVIINSILLVIGTSKNVTENPSVNSAFDVASNVFLAIYTTEVTMQLIYHGLHVFKDYWLLFDIILIVMCWIFQFSPSFRTFRVLRVVHVIPKFEAMRSITETISRSIPKVIDISTTTLVFFYVFGVMFTTLFKDKPIGADGFSFDYFSRLDRTLLTLFQLMTIDEGALIYRESAIHLPWASSLIPIFSTITGLLLVNVIIALICQAQDEVAEQKEKKIRQKTDDFDKSYEDRVSNIKLMYSDVRDLLHQSHTHSILHQSDTHSDIASS